MVPGGGYGARRALSTRRHNGPQETACAPHPAPLPLPHRQRSRREALMSFRITGLKFADFAALIALPEAELLEHNARRVVADRAPGFPCRVSLIDAHPGERVLLVNW